MDNKKDKSPIDLEDHKLHDNLRSNLQGDDLAQQLRADLGTNDPTADVFDHQQSLIGSDHRQKLSALKNLESDLPSTGAKLPDNLKQELQRLDDLTKPKKNSLTDFDF